MQNPDRAHHEEKTGAGPTAPNGTGQHHEIPPDRPTYRFSGELPPALEPLRARRQWLTWDYVYNEKKKKWDKPPRSAHAGRLASINNHANLGTFAEAAATAAGEGLAGVGYLLMPDDDLTGIDLDDCISDSGSYSALAAEIIGYAETYAETSPSGQGIRLFAQGKIAKAFTDNPSGVEVYGTGRYLTVTGLQIEGTPSEIRPAPRTLAKLTAIVEAAQGAKRAKANGKGNGTATGGGKTQAGGDTFWDKVNAAALANLDAWVPALHPTARKQPNGAWRVTSADFKRGLQEDLAYYPAGIRDHGEEEGHTPINAVLKYGTPANVTEAAAWLCHRLRVEPASLGFRKAPGPNGHTAPDKRAGDPEIPTEAALSDAFVDQHGEQLRYVASWSKWFRYDGQVWREEKTQLVRHLTKLLCQETAGEADTRELRSIASSRTVSGVQTLAQADRRVAAVVDQWDTDPWLLNTPGGTVNLRARAVQPHSPDDHATKMTGAVPAENADCQLWLGFLSRIFAGDLELIAYMQRVLGYSLTGITKEHAMFFAFGTGGNGKSVMFDTVAGIMGDYHTTAPIETFTASPGDRHPTELADLVGARLVTAIETELGHAWAETRIKTLTGGDRVKARFMRQDFFEFRPQFKLMVAGNHQPVLRIVDEAIKRRFNMIPFEVTIPAAERDPDLAEKLKTEWPQILRWMLDGCLAWQEQGLQPPAAVTQATGGYLEAQDGMGAWLAECCEVKSSFQEKALRLYCSWKAYAERVGEEPGSMKTFSPRLQSRGFPRAENRKAGSVYQGLRIIPNEPPPHYDDR